MPGFTKLYSTIITSSIWSEDAEICKVWVTLLALADADGFVAAALPGLANAARLPLDRCAEVMKKLEAPDPYSRSPENEGRRVEAVRGGWLLLNYKYYREMRGESPVSANPRRVQSRALMRKLRAERKKEEMLTDANLSASASKEGESEGKPKSNREWHPTPEQLRLNALYKRRETTPWTQSELKAWRRLTPIAEEDLKAVERFFAASENDPHKGYRRHDLGTLLNNFNAEVDRARQFKEQKPF